jgi:putative ABC transport system permease protein
VLGEGVSMAGLGIGVGALCGFALARLIGGYVTNVELPGVLPVAASALLLIVAAVGASLVPAARAARVDVMQALRSE